MRREAHTTQHGRDARPAPASRAPIIMVVEDESSIREILCQFLESEGYRVVSARDGLEAMAQLDEVRPDLVVSDVMMPVVDGSRLAKMICARESLREVPVVGITALSRLTRATYSSFAAVIAKPFDLDHLLRVISGLLGQRQQAAS